MFEIDYKSIKKGNKLPYIFLLIGVLLTILFLFLFISKILKKNSLDREVKTDYIVPNEHYDDDGDLMYSPVYYYTVNGEQYSCSAGFSSSKRPPSSGTVYYKKGDPKNCMTDYSLGTNWIYFVIAGVGVLFGAVGFIFLNQSRKHIKKAKYLSQNGKLIKGIPYTMENSNIVVNGRTIQKIAIDYPLPDGQVVHLTGYPRYDRKYEDEDGLVDLLIDPNDPNNYFIDFEIKYSGNVQVEEYKDPIKQVTPQPVKEEQPNPTTNEFQATVSGPVENPNFNVNNNIDNNQQ